MNHHNSKQRRLLFPHIIILLPLFLAACNKDQHNHPTLKTGKDFYNYHCASCHQEDGSGMFLKGIPANVATNKNQTEIILHIKQGSRSNNYQMPVYSDMPDQEAQKIARHLLQLKKNYFNNPENKDKILLKQ